MKILLVDDEEDTRSIGSMSLSLLGGNEVIEADCGQVALEKAFSEKPDVILLDVMMPGMDGPTTLGHLLSNDQTKHIPIIFLTAKAMSSEIDRLKRLGARGVVTKPYDPTTLTSQIMTILGN